MEDIKETRPSRLSSIDIWTNRDMRRAGRDVSKVGSLSRNYLQLTTAHKGKMSSLYRRLTGDANHMQGQAPCLAVDGQQKMNSVVFLEVFFFS